MCLTDLPRNRAKCSAVRQCANALKVALTTFLPQRDGPIDFAKTSLTPRAFITARTAPPAIRPVPAYAELNHHTGRTMTAMNIIRNSSAT